MSTKTTKTTKTNDKTVQERKDRINATLWKGCGTFRCGGDPSAHKNHLLIILFIKYISDVYGDRRATIEAKHKGDKTRIKRELTRERFKIPERASFQYLFDRRNATNLGELIDKATAALEEANPVLARVFRNISFNSDNLGKTKDRNRSLKALLESYAVDDLDLRPSAWPNTEVADVIGDSYMYLIEKFAADSGKKGGEFYTPDQVSRLVAQLAAPKAGDRICDPASGSAGLLIRAGQAVTDAKGKPSDNVSLYGMESNGETWALGKINLFIHNVDADRNMWCNTLTSPEWLENDTLQRFDIVVANPPFSLKSWGAEAFSSDKGDINDEYNRFHRGLPPKSNGDYAFLSHMVEVAKPLTGRVAVIVPHGVLFRGGKEGTIRKAFIEENLLDAVIGLPEGLFYGTGIPAAILVFDKSRQDGGTNEERSDVIFIDASNEYDPGKNRNKLTDCNLKKIVDTYRERKAIEKYSHLADLAEIKENDYNLNIPRYVDTFEEVEPVDIKAVKKETASIDKKLVGARAKLDTSIHTL